MGNKLFHHPHQFRFNHLPRFAACERAVMGDDINGVVDVNLF